MPEFLKEILIVFLRYGNIDSNVFSFGEKSKRQSPPNLSRCISAANTSSPSGVMLARKIFSYFLDSISAFLSFARELNFLMSTLIIIFLLLLPITLSTVMLLLVTVYSYSTYKPFRI